MGRRSPTRRGELAGNGDAAGNDLADGPGGVRTVPGRSHGKVVVRGRLNAAIAANIWRNGSHALSHLPGLQGRRWSRHAPLRSKPADDVISPLTRISADCDRWRRRHQTRRRMTGPPGPGWAGPSPPGLDQPCDAPRLPRIPGVSRTPPRPPPSAWPDSNAPRRVSTCASDPTRRSPGACQGCAARRIPSSARTSPRVYRSHDRSRRRCRPMPLWVGPRRRPAPSPTPLRSCERHAPLPPPCITRRRPFASLACLPPCIHPADRGRGVGPKKRRGPAAVSGKSGRCGWGWVKASSTFDGDELTVMGVGAAGPKTRRCPTRAGRGSARRRRRAVTATRVLPTLRPAPGCERHPRPPLPLSLGGDQADAHRLARTAICPPGPPRDDSAEGNRSGVSRQPARRDHDPRRGHHAAP